MTEEIIYAEGVTPTHEVRGDDEIFGVEYVGEFGKHWMGAGFTKPADNSMRWFGHWTASNVMNRCIAFAKEHGRWPGDSDEDIIAIHGVHALPRFKKAA